MIPKSEIIINGWVEHCGAYIISLTILNVVIEYE